jgi:hypothetical protein
MQVPEFYRYFKENMESMGLQAPETLFGSLASAVETASTIFGQVDTLGKNVTLNEIIGAGSRLEHLAVLGTCSAAFYVGAVVGSIAVATGSSGNSTTISDVLFAAKKYGLDNEWLKNCLMIYPGIYQTTYPGRQHYCQMSFIV